MSAGRQMVVLVVSWLLVGTAAYAAGPRVVSPGAADRSTVVSSRRPTFSWTDSGSANPVEVLVYPVSEEGETARRPVIRERLPGRARSFTPPGHLGLQPGERYAWTVRSIGPGASEASEPAFFQIASVHPEDDLREALAVIERYLGAHGGPIATRSASAKGPRRPAEVTAEDAEPDAAPSSIGLIDRFEVDRAGKLTATSLTVTELTCPGCIGSASQIESGTVTTDDILDGTIGASDLSSGSVSKTNIRLETITGDNVQDGTLTSADLGDASAGQPEIAEGAVEASEIDVDAVTSSDLAVDSVGEAEIADDAVGGLQLGDIRVVSVECFGECDDSSLGTICGTGYRAFLVDCENIADGVNGSNCGGDNVCAVFLVSNTVSLGAYCADADVAGWDAHVYCLSD